MTTEQAKEAQLRKKIQYQVGCEEKAFRIVERLIENPVEQDWFIDSLQFITPSHYQDIVEERAISKLCGYPICPNPLGNVPTQKYFISTRSNKVYDVEERKNFCNSRCYKASQYIEKQISTEPVWSRKPQTRRVLDLLPLDMKMGKLGDEVQLTGVDEVKTELQKLERLDHYQQSLEQMGDTHRTTTDNKDKADNSTQNKGKADNSTHHSGKTDTTEENVYTLDKALSEMVIGDGEHRNEKVERIEDKTKTVNKEKDKNEAVSDIVKETTETGSLLENKPKEMRTDSKPKEKKGHSKKTKAADSSQQAKTEYLMRLLDKKKNLLAKMADIQSESEVNGSQPVAEVTGIASRDKKAEKLGERDSEIVGKEVENFDSGKKIEHVVVKEQCISEISVRNEITRDTSVSGDKQNKSLKTNSLDTDQTPGNAASDQDPNCLTEDVGEGSQVETSKEMKPVSLTVIRVICQSVKSWITQQTTDYLKKEALVSEARAEMSQCEKQYNKQYRALVAKVDAQEREFSDLIGEESLEQDSGTKPLAPAPHFEVLRDELEGDQLRVREFMKGSFTYRENKDKGPKVDKNQREVVLPSVDKYDQMLIRQRIVLDRINKVLPDLLQPLHLPVGDIFSDVRQLTETFNFTRENILFKPAEWTLVTLILLKLLSRKLTKLSTAFERPSAEQFLTILLTGIKTDIDTLNHEVTLLTRV